MLRLNKTSLLFSQPRQLIISYNSINVSQFKGKINLAVASRNYRLGFSNNSDMFYQSVKPWELNKHPILFIPKKQFHHNTVVQQPLLLPPLFVKGIYYVARVGVSLVPYVFNSKFFKKYRVFFLTLIFGTVFICCSLIVYSLNRNPFTGRLRLILNDQETEAYFENKKFGETLDKAIIDIISETMWKDTLLRISNDILKVSGLNLKEELAIRVVKDEQPILIVTYGGCMLISTEMLRFFQGNSKLFAVAFGHQVAHMLCQHSSEATGMSAIFSLFMDFFRVGVYSLSFSFPFFSDAIAVGVFEVQEKYFNTFYNKKLEKEANIISLHLLSRAGYDPNSVITFWEKMENSYGAVSVENKDDSFQTGFAGIANYFNTNEDFYSLHPLSPEHLNDIKEAIQPALDVLKLTKNHQELDSLIDCQYLKKSLSILK